MGEPTPLTISSESENEQPEFMDTSHNSSLITTSEAKRKLQRVRNSVNNLGGDSRCLFDSKRILWLRNLQNIQ